MKIDVEENRKIRIDTVPKQENSPLFCNLVLIKDMGKEEMKHSKASGSTTIIGLTKQEAKDIHNLFGLILK